MNKIAAMGMVLFLAAGCAEVTQDVQNVIRNTEGPIVAEEGQVQNGIHLVAYKPADDCVFKGGILGDANPDEAGVPSSIFNISRHIREGLASNARRMGGNTVWLRTANWRNPDVSADYYQSFFVDNVEYSALVYDCPVR